MSRALADVLAPLVLIAALFGTGALIVGGVETLRDVPAVAGLR